MAASRGTHWTTREIEAIVEDYFDMLETELAGGAVVKAERNRTLQNVIDRCRGSIEYKHQNVSTVMAALGLPFIQGYKPAVHYQHALRDARARALGEAGEAFLYQAEQNRLSAHGRDDLAGKVRWVAKEDGDGAGYDILSFSKRGDVRWLEAKTTNGPATTPFWITENERRVSEERPDVFRLARLYDFSRTPAAFRLKPPLTEHVRLAPTQYRATF